jgi:hypothetical protein
MSVAAGRRRVIGGADSASLVDAGPGAGREAAPAVFSQEMGGCRGPTDV